MGEYKLKIDSLAEKIETAMEAVKAQTDVLNKYVGELRDLRDPIDKIEEKAGKSSE